MTDIFHQKMSQFSGPRLPALGESFLHKQKNVIEDYSVADLIRQVDSVGPELALCVIERSVGEVGFVHGSPGRPSFVACPVHDL